jgi:hypothetical protein
MLIKLQVSGIESINSIVGFRMRNYGSLLRELKGNLPSDDRSASAEALQDNTFGEFPYTEGALSV